MKFSELPKLREPLENGIFAGITTKPEGTHWAVVLLPDRGVDLTWKKAVTFAKKLDAELPTPLIAPMLATNVRTQLPLGWHWTSDENGTAYAWLCNFDTGYILTRAKSYEGSAVAVRLIPLTA